MEIIRNVDQGSDEWKDMRKGMLTGTRLKSLMGTASAKSTLKYEIISERFGSYTETPQSQAMKDGIIWEDWAKESFENITFNEVEEVTFIKRDDFHGLSPDGIIENNGKYTEAVEIKSPQGKNFIKYCLENIIPKEYHWQVINYFIVMEDLEKLHFVIYNPTIDKIKNTHIIEVTRKELQKDIDKAIEKIEEFKIEIEKDILSLQKI